MEFRILGPLEVVDGRKPVSLEASKQRTLLGVLLLHPNEVVSTERLIDELWGDRPPATAIKILQTYVSQLRKSVGSELIVTRPPGYLLHVEKDALDAEQFRRLTGDARRAAAIGERERADALYGEALALWRGPPLADVPFESFACNEVERLEEERIGALIDRIDCRLALGLHDELVPELEELVKQYPFRERLRAQLMLALYRSGRQADALAAYRDARRTLLDELGLEPGSELLELEKAILTHDNILEVPPRADRSKPPMARQLLQWRLLAGIALVLVVLALALAFGLTNRSRPKHLASNSIGFVDAKSGRLTRSFAVGRKPVALVVADGSVWVASYKDEDVNRIDEATGRRVDIPLKGLHPTGITAFGSTVWVLTLEAMLVPINPRFNSTGQPVPLPDATRAPGHPEGGRIAAGGGFLWITAPAATVIRVDPTKPRRSLSIVPDSGAVGAITYEGQEVWVAGASSVFPIAARSGIPGGEIEVGFPVRDLAFGAGSLWVVSGGPGHSGGAVEALRRVNTRTRLVQMTTSVGSDPVAVAYANGSIWAASRSDGTIARIDPATSQPDDTINVGASPKALAADKDGIWVAVE